MPSSFQRVFLFLCRCGNKCHIGHNLRRFLQKNFIFFRIRSTLISTIGRCSLLTILATRFHRRYRKVISFFDLD